MRPLKKSVHCGFRYLMRTQGHGVHIQLFACDIGGLIVKQALLIAYSDEKYRPILERICLLVRKAQFDNSLLY